MNLTYVWYETGRKLRRLISWRFYRGIWQLWWRGWCDCDTWGLDTTLSAMALPRLRRFRETYHSFPCDTTVKGWDKEIDEIVWALEWVVNDEENDVDKPLEEAQSEVSRANAAFENMGRRWRDLWD